MNKGVCRYCGKPAKLKNGIICDVCTHRRKDVRWFMEKLEPYRVALEKKKARARFMNFEDVKKIRQNPTMDDVDNKCLSEMIDLAVEKQIPKRPIILGYREGREINTISYTCPACNKHIGRENYCKHCGQALDWGERE